MLIVHTRRAVLVGISTAQYAHILLKLQEHVIFYEWYQARAKLLVWMNAALRH